MAMSMKENEQIIRLMGLEYSIKRMELNSKVSKYVLTF